MKKNFLRMLSVVALALIGIGNLSASKMVGTFVRYHEVPEEWEGTYVMAWAFDGKAHNVINNTSHYYDVAAADQQLFPKNTAGPDTLYNVELSQVVTIAKGSVEGTYSIQVPTGEYLAFDPDDGVIASTTPYNFYMSYVNAPEKMREGWLISDENNFEISSENTGLLLASSPGQYTRVYARTGFWQQPMYGLPYIYKLVSTSKLPEIENFARCTRNVSNWEGEYVFSFAKDGKAHSVIEGDQFVAAEDAPVVYEAGKDEIEVDIDYMITVAKGTADNAFSVQLPNGKYFAFGENGVVESETAADLYLRYITLPNFREGLMISDANSFVGYAEGTDAGNAVLYNKDDKYGAYKNVQGDNSYVLPIAYKKVVETPIVQTGTFIRYHEVPEEWEGTYVMAWAFDGKAHNVINNTSHYYDVATADQQLFTKNTAGPDTLYNVDLSQVVTIAKGSTEGTYSIQVPTGEYLALDPDDGVIASAEPFDLYMSYINAPEKMREGWLISDENNFEISSENTGLLLASSPGQYTRVYARTGFWVQPMYGLPYIYKMVVKPATSFTLDKHEAEVELGEILQLAVTINPEDTSEPLYTWASTDETIATVDNGLVTTVGAGEVMIIATHSTGKFADTCVVNVKVSVASVSVDPTEASLKVGEQLTINTTVLPEQATNKTITWSTTDEGVATVAEGVVTAVAAGEATITATTEDGLKTATCVVTVVPTGLEDVNVDSNVTKVVRNGQIYIIKNDEVYNVLGTSVK